MKIKGGQGAWWGGGWGAPLTLDGNLTSDGNLTLGFPFFLCAERTHLGGPVKSWVQDLAFGWAAYTIVLTAMSNFGALHTQKSYALCDPTRTIQLPLLTSCTSFSLFLPWWSMSSLRGSPGCSLCLQTAAQLDLHSLLGVWLKCHQLKRRRSF